MASGIAANTRFDWSWFNPSSSIRGSNLRIKIHIFWIQILFQNGTSE